MNKPSPHNSTPQTIRINRSQLLFRGLLLVLLLALLGAYLTHVIRSENKLLIENNQRPIFQQFIDDASKTNSEQHIAELFAINSENSRLQWQEYEGETWVAMLSWMPADIQNSYYKIGETGQSSPDRNIWLTAIPQVKDFCRQLNYADKSFRIKQYLGLNPHNRYETFVELWVRPKDLFRPCPDPEITDSHCELTLNTQNPPQVTGIKDYVGFYQKLRENSYSAAGAPWTRLGYTYDWANQRRNVGASEYILVPRGKYRVRAASATALYCKN